MIDIVAATKNRGKLREIAAALTGLPVRLVSLGDYPGAPEVIEDGDTFSANAAKKARAIASDTRQYALADDSGLMVDALGGAPGVYSARYAGANADDAANLRKLLAALDEIPARPRSARFICVIALADPAGRVVLAEGRVEGEIIAAPRGQNGFGYDPVFLYPPLGRTFAELTAPEKLAVSHRGIALRELAEKIRDLVPLDSDANHGTG
jgi:XTP/dITP diphosphohydrolase